MASSFIFRSYFPYSHRSTFIAGDRAAASVAFPVRHIDGIKFMNGKSSLRTMPPFVTEATKFDTIDENSIQIFSGTANPALSQEITRLMGLDLRMIHVGSIADGETYVDVPQNVFRRDVYLVQPTCPPYANVLELLLMIEACRKAGAKTITAIIPYFGFTTAYRQTKGKDSGTTKLMATLISQAGAHRVLTMDLHSEEFMDYFTIPVQQVHGQTAILDYLVSKAIPANDLVVVSPDVRGIARARTFSKKLSSWPLAIVDKSRHGHNFAEVTNLIGDVKGKIAIMITDMIDTAGTIAEGAALLRREGAREVYACATHAVFSNGAIEKLSSGLFNEVIVTNTISVTKKKHFRELSVLSVANVFAERIQRLHLLDVLEHYSFPVTRPAMPFSNRKVNN